jgi:hypothetical protein
MRLFILTDSNFTNSGSLIYQKTWDLIEAGMSLDMAHFYIVGNAIPANYVRLFSSHSNYNEYAKVEIVGYQAAQKLMASLTNVIIIHFGADLKGSERFPHYFIPLWHPIFNRSLSLLQNWLQNRKFESFLKKSINTICLNEWVLNTIKLAHPKYAYKASLGYLPTTPLPVFEWQQLAACKDEIAGGNNYFLAFIPLSEMIATLKEFSIFKKWQQTSMALVFVFENEAICAKAKSFLKGYKFKEAIFILPKSGLKKEWIAATYAALWSGAHFDSSFLMEEAVQFHIPLLLNTNNNLPDSWGKAGEYFDFSTKLALSNHFKLYYKDEVYRQARSNMGHAWLNQQNTNGELQFETKLPMCLK